MKERRFPGSAARIGSAVAGTMLAVAFLAGGLAPGLAQAAQPARIAAHAARGDAKPLCLPKCKACKFCG